jgi:arylsulfatase A-like enzyme
MPSNKPNLFFICCDDLNDAISGLGGHPQAYTPNLDRLAERGVRFTNAQVSAPLCGPSRASFLSGIAPWKSNYYGYNMSYDPWWDYKILNDQPTFMEHAGANGYGVYGTGKIFHNGQEKLSVWNREHGHSVDWGPWSWDGQKEGSNWGACAGHQDMPFEPTPDSLFSSLDRIPDIPANPETNAPGYKGWRNGDNTVFHYKSAQDRDLMNDELNAKWAAEVLSRSHLEEPFMLCMGIGRPHSPFIAPQEYFDLFPLEDIQLSPQILEGDVDDCAKIMRDGDTTTTDWGFRKYNLFYNNGGEETLKRWTQAYLACVAFADACIGEALDALWNGPNADNTYIIMTSDNGYHMGEKSYLFKNSLWERSARVPLLVSGPTCEKGVECERPVSLLDLYPTINELLDLPTLADDKTLDGHSFANLTHDSKANWTGPKVAVTALGSSTPASAADQAKREDQHFSARSITHRYILYSNGEEELYDHVNDPYEWHNIANHSEAEEIKNKINNELKQQVRI